MKDKIGLILLISLFAFSNSYASPPDWEIISGTEFSMIFMTDITLNGESFVESDGYNIAAAFGPAYCDSVNDCRSVASWQQPNPPYWEGYWYFTIVGNENGQEIIFKIYDAETDSIYQCYETVSFVNNATVGSPYDPELLSAGQLTAPSDVHIQITDNEDSVKISWAEDNYVNQVYYSENPAASFPENWNLAGTAIIDDEIILPITSEKMFFKIIAIVEE